MCHHDVLYTKVSNFLLGKYTSNKTIIQIKDEIKNLRHLPNQRASDFPNYNCSRTNRCDCPYGPINQIFIHGIEHQIREQTTSYWSDQPDIDFESLASFTNGLNYTTFLDANDGN